MKSLAHLPGEALRLLAPACRRGTLTLLLIIAAAALLASPRATAQSGEKIITTVAGGGFEAVAPAAQAPVEQPLLAARDPLGRGVYFIDLRDDATSLLRFVNTSTSTHTIAGVTIPAGQVGLIAGGGELDPIDGNPLREVDLSIVSGIDVDPSGNIVFLAIGGFWRSIYAVNTTSQTVNFQSRQIQPGLLAGLISVGGVSDIWALLRTPDNRFFVIGQASSGGFSRVYRVGSGETEVYAGGGNPPPEENGDGGPATGARIIQATGLAFDSEGALLISEGNTARSSGSIRRVTPDGIISTIVEGLEYPAGVSRAPNGDIYIALGNSQRILRTGPAGGSTTPIVGDTSGQSCNFAATPTCGDGGPALSAKLNLPGSSSFPIFFTQMAVDENGLYIADNLYPHVRYVNLSANPVTLAGKTIGSQQIDSIVGNGRPEPFDGVQAPFATLNDPHGVAVSPEGNLFISDTLHFALRFVNRGNSAITLFAGTPSAQTVGPGEIITLNRDANEAPIGNQIITTSFNTLQGLYAVPNGVFIADSQAGLRFPSSFDPSSGLLRFLNTSSSPVQFYPNSATPITVAPGEVRIIAGKQALPRPETIGDGGPATSAIVYVSDVVVDSAGNIYVTDYFNDRVRRIDAMTGVITTLFANLNKPAGLALDNQGRLLIADTYNNRILRQNAPGGGEFTTIADASLPAPSRPISEPRDIVATSDGKIFVVNGGGNQILELNAPTNGLGTTSVLAGTGVAGFSGDGGPASQASLRLPNPNNESNFIATANIALLPDNSLVFTDTDNDRVRQVTLSAPVGPLATVSAASFTLGAALASESIVASFGNNLATGTATAATIPLPKELLGTTVTVKDGSGVERMADLFFVSPTQVNFQIPPETAAGQEPVTITIRSGDGSVSMEQIQISNVAPGVFAANSSGTGVAAAQVLRVRGATQTIEPTAQFDGSGFTHVPIDLGPEGDQVFLILYGTGIRFRSGLTNVSVQIGDIVYPVAYAGAQGGFVGLDQVNIGPLMRSQAGAGVVEVKLVVDGQTANTVTVQIQ